MCESVSIFDEILAKEDEVLSALLVSQKELRKAVTDKDWISLNKVSLEINELTQTFLEVDAQRDLHYQMLKTEELALYGDKIRNLRAKLLKYKTGNEALGKFVQTSRDFIQNVIENAVPQRGNKTYSKSGKIVQNQPQCVVLNQLF